MATIMTVESSAVPPGASVVSIRGREALSEPYLLEVGLRTTSGRVDLDGLGAAIHVEVVLASSSEYVAVIFRSNGSHSEDVTGPRGRRSMTSSSASTCSIRETYPSSRPRAAACSMPRPRTINGIRRR